MKKCLMLSGAAAALDAAEHAGAHAVEPARRNWGPALPAEVEHCDHELQRMGSAPETNRPTDDAAVVLGRARGVTVIPDHKAPFYFDQDPLPHRVQVPVLDAKSSAPRAADFMTRLVIAFPKITKSTPRTTRKTMSTT